MNNTPNDLEPVTQTLDGVGCDSEPNPHRYLNALGKAMEQLAWGNERPHYYVDANTGRRVWATWNRPDLSKVEGLRKVYF